MSAIVTRHGSGSQDAAFARRTARGGAMGSIAVVVAVVMALMFPSSDGGSAAAGDVEDKAAATAASAIDLAGRWTGRHHSYSMRAPAAETCGGKSCTLTLDIVACDAGWCGIMVPGEAHGDKPCGAVALRVTTSPKDKTHSTFTGKIELAKGSAPFVIEAWYRPPGSTAGEGHDQAHLNMVGDTGGGEMLMMRRSFPFSAELARTGDAQCTLDKATS